MKELETPIDNCYFFFFSISLFFHKILRVIMVSLLASISCVFFNFVIISNSSSEIIPKSFDNVNTLTEGPSSFRIFLDRIFLTGAILQSTNVVYPLHAIFLTKYCFCH